MRYEILFVLVFGLSGSLSWSAPLHFKESANDKYFSALNQSLEGKGKVRIRLSCGNNNPLTQQMRLDADFELDCSSGGKCFKDGYGDIPDYGVPFGTIAKTGKVSLQGSYTCNKDGGSQLGTECNDSTINSDNSFEITFSRNGDLNYWPDNQIKVELNPKNGRIPLDSGSSIDIMFLVIDTTGQTPFRPAPVSAILSYWPLTNDGSTRKFSLPDQWHKEDPQSHACHFTVL